ncbi:carbohydrate sulfotransferase 15-like [Lineus longissimus]|uniref:carbohydrate sulfotransferase 15-like n=1 Tax=Lineus longissimus TaxID=88925 RepID=UPI00315D487F
MYFRTNVDIYKRCVGEYRFTDKLGMPETFRWFYRVITILANCIFRRRILNLAGVTFLVLIGLNTYKLSTSLWVSNVKSEINNRRHTRIDFVMSEDILKAREQHSALSENVSRVRTDGLITREDILEDLASYVPVSDAPKDVLTAEWFGRFKPADLSLNLDIEPPAPATIETKLKTRCWRLIEKDNDMACLPYFYLLGFPKAGTTDFWYRLHEHPEIVRNYKEHHFWTRKKYKYPLHKVGRYYRQMLNLESRKKFNTTIWQQPNLIIGDGSPSYYWDVTYRERMLTVRHEPRAPDIVVGNLIKAYTPDAKFITLIRDPAETVYSHYLYINSTWAKSPQIFHHRVVHTISIYLDCFRSYSVRACAYNGDMVMKANEQNVRLYTGLYAVYIHDWLRIFPRAQFLFVKTEEYKEDTANHIKKAFSFLKASEPSTTVMDRIKEYESVNTQEKIKSQMGQMLPETRKLLDRFYEPFNQVLAELLQDEKWKMNS